MGFVLFSPFFLHLNIFLWSDIPTATTFSLFSANPMYNKAQLPQPILSQSLIRAC
ncbi:hypothetical protein RintRC_4167 [Richelia intracellularis]|nr:hypothetical protein RintRC_4167 [Richelia intracellularis]